MIYRSLAHAYPVHARLALKTLFVVFIVIVLAASLGLKFLPSGGKARHGAIITAANTLPLDASDSVDTCPKVARASLRRLRASRVM